MNLVQETLATALAEATKSNHELKRRACLAVDALQRHVTLDNGRKVLTAGAKLMPLLSTFGGEHALTPGELALILEASMHNVLLALPGMTPELARAVAIELASGPRSE